MCSRQFYISRINFHVHLVAETSFRNNLDYLITIMCEIELPVIECRSKEAYVHIFGYTHVLANEK